MINFILKHSFIFFPSIGIAVSLIIVYGRDLNRLYRRALNKIFPSTTPAWKIAMDVRRPDGSRGRRLSLHTLATLTNRTDLIQLAKEMKWSGEVNTIFCPVVKSPVFYLRSTWADTDSSVWKKIPKFLENHPFPKIRGFQSSDGEWTGGAWGKGKYIRPEYAMSDPFVKSDHAYANRIIRALQKAGIKPGIEEYKLDKNERYDGLKVF